MDNYAYTPDAEQPSTTKMSSSHMSLMEEEIELARQRSDPSTFNAPLGIGEMSGRDKFNFFFLVAFPVVSFILSIVLTETLQ